MNTLKPIVKGNLTGKAEALAELEKLVDAPAGTNPRNPPIDPPADINLQNGFYLIERPAILAATTQEYRRFLREAGYADLDSCSQIGFAKGILKYNQDVRDAAQTASLSLNGQDGDYVVNINHPNARKLVEALGFKLSTTALMYRLFIPYIKDSAQTNLEAKATLKEMVDTKAEWLEDLVLDKSKVKIGSKTKKLTLPQTDNRFDRADLNEFGYPDQVKSKGEFYYWHPKSDEIAVIRNGNSELNLYLNGEPSIENDRLGVRPVKIFS